MNIPKILFICSPNNPTGNDVELARIRSLCAQFKGIVVVDEAYIDFSQQASCTALLSEFPDAIRFNKLSLKPGGWRVFVWAWPLLLLRSSSYSIR